MNRKFLSLFSFVLLLTTSCQKTDDNTMEFDMVSIDKTVNLTNEELSPRCTVSLKLAFATEENGHRADVVNNTIEEKLLNTRDVSMKKAVTDFADKYIKDYKHHMLPLYNEDRSDTTKRAWYQFHYVISAETHPEKQGFYVYLATIDYYEGGDYGVNQLITFNFRTKTGQLMQLNDVFLPGYEKQLNQVLLDALKEKEGVGSLGELKAKGYLTSMQMFPSENFILDDETITFIYNPSEIAARDMGPTELIIPYSDIESILKNSFVSNLQ